MILLFGWLSTQAAALHHEFSAEHWQSEPHEICLSLAFIHDDDSLEPQANTTCVTHNLQFEAYFQLIQLKTSQQTFSPIKARAPPAYTQ